MSLPVCPSAFIRLAVAMCSVSSTLRGRPNLAPCARDDALLGRLAPDTACARQVGVISKHLGLIRSCLLLDPLWVLPPVA
jgi:hypothetical protein